ncbi:hypothetical protein M422DRAFT_66808 [Sphaerobolus stellatus SS14]|uniref:Unplaced genomic scaffold SPHSTscaffold_124, whole genome shotgun sequence n=1 Tax=Sphaerobolus stellatus (strain SS14) TaxID=990650 RepID=A0A0C9UTF8_SPHS4|nr:hypothetical protein M422DRAFT_70216 [Sphaerobolus stellatus SS14]KIJ46133.1 hypothetical protein M422DRAFT_66808 [Sphaerobolus stellatus SS14]
MGRTQEGWTRQMAFAFLLWSRLSRGQATASVVCKTDLWTVNTQGQSPCLLAAALTAPCSGGSFSVTPLPPDVIYTGPQSSNKCQCSSVTYSLIAACASCQGQSFFKWSSWITNCSSSDITIGSYPFLIPGGAGVPNWAFQNVTENDSWDIKEALILHNEDDPSGETATTTATEILLTASKAIPTSTPGSISSQISSTSNSLPTPTSVTTNSPSVTIPAPTSPMPSGGAATESESQANSKSEGSLRDGLIAASAVGGFLLLCLVAIGIILLVKQRRKQRSRIPLQGNMGVGAFGPFGAFGGMELAKSDPRQDYRKSDVMEYANVDPRRDYTAHYANIPGVFEEEPPKRYDPADPQTFPPTPPFNYRNPWEISNPRPPIVLRGLNEYSYARRSGPLSALSP